MGDKSKPGFFGKFLAVLSGKPDEVREAESVPKSPYAPKEEDPVDLRFVRKFTENGGKFLYCENFEEALIFLIKILEEVNSSNVMITQPDIQELLQRKGVKTEGTLNSSGVVCTTCEALVAFNGGIMITDHQTGGFRINELPDIHVVIGKATQIVDNLSAGMSRINSTYRNQRPSQILTLKAPLDELVRQAAADPNKERTLYLLLVEEDN